jgi:hypothetical protein
MEKANPNIHEKLKQLLVIIVGKNSKSWR